MDPDPHLFPMPQEVSVTTLLFGALALCSGAPSCALRGSAEAPLTAVTARAAPGESLWFQLPSLLGGRYMSDLRSPWIVVDEVSIRAGASGQPSQASASIVTLREGRLLDERSCLAPLGVIAGLQRALGAGARVVRVYAEQNLPWATVWSVLATARAGGFSEAHLVMDGGDALRSLTFDLTASESPVRALLTGEGVILGAGTEFLAPGCEHLGAAATTIPDLAQRFDLRSFHTCLHRARGALASRFASSRVAVVSAPPERPFAHVMVLSEALHETLPGRADLYAALIPGVIRGSASSEPTDARCQAAREGADEGLNVAVGAAIRGQVGRVRGCYEDARRANPRLASGSIEVSFDVRGDGAFERVTVRADSGFEAVSACVSGLLLSLHGPAHDRAPVRFAFPFAFSP